MNMPKKRRAMKGEVNDGAGKAVVEAEEEAEGEGEGDEEEKI
jgi:hypothetical protein